MDKIIHLLGICSPVILLLSAVLLVAAKKWHDKKVFKTMTVKMPPPQIVHKHDLKLMYLEVQVTGEEIRRDYRNFYQCVPDVDRQNFVAEVLRRRMIDAINQDIHKIIEVYRRDTYSSYDRDNWYAKLTIVEPKFE